MSDLAVSSSLLIATMDLNLVRSVIAAMRTADLTTAAEAGSQTAAVTRSPACGSTQPIQASAYVRNVDKPAATFEHCSSCAVHHWHTRLGPLQPYTDTRAVPPPQSKCVIQPPWRVLPWPIAAKPCFPPGHAAIKVPSNRTDVSEAGRTLDLFI